MDLILFIIFFIQTNKIKKEANWRGLSRRKRLVATISENEGICGQIIPINFIGFFYGTSTHLFPPPCLLQTFEGTYCLYKAECFIKK